MVAKEINQDPAEAQTQLENFEDPIEFVYLEHERLRRCCDELVQLGEQLNTEDAPAKAASILDYLENELPLHLADEEEDLFPLLKRRSPSDEGMISVLKLLCIEHRQDVECGRSLIEALRRIARGGQPLDPAMFRDYVRSYAMLQRRHHAMENTAVLPLAAELLTPEDIAELSCSMAARRGGPGQD